MDLVLFHHLFTLALVVSRTRVFLQVDLEEEGTLPMLDQMDSLVQIQFE